MRLASILAATAFAGALAGCAADPYYARSSAPGYYAPGYPYSSPPRYYRTTTYNYSYPQQYYSQGRTYDGYWDYQRNYRGIHASPEASRL